MTCYTFLSSWFLHAWVMAINFMSFCVIYRFVLLILLISFIRKNMFGTSFPWSTFFKTDIIFSISIKAA